VTQLISIIDSHPAQAGWMCVYVAQTPEAPIIVPLPVVLWVLIEYNGTLADGTEGTVQQFRPYIVNRHGAVADYTSVLPQMDFLCVVPPFEDWKKVGQAAFEEALRGRAALEAAKRLDEQRKQENDPPKAAN
jgi:hypothetical protein